MGVVLVLGGLGHSGGVIHLYATAGVPDANRVLLDIWIAEAHFVSGGLYLAASRALQAGSRWRALSSFGALSMIGLTIAILPVLFTRAPPIFRVPPVIYLVSSLVILVRTAAITAGDRRA